MRPTRGAALTERDPTEAPASTRPGLTAEGTRRALLARAISRRKGRLVRRSARSALPALACVALGVALGAFIGVYSVVHAGYDALAGGMPDPANFRRTPLSQTSVVQDAAGRPVAELPGAERREVVASDEMDRDLKDAAVAVEDRRFYLHAGVDAQGIARAAWQNVRAGGVAQGGSTITQQLVRHLYLPPDRRMEVSVGRKWVEGALALAYEREHTKREILGDYLNAAYFGQGAYGAEAASRTYFSRPADDLEVHQAALLAGILQLPSFYDPFANPQAARERRDLVLGEMREAGYLTDGEFEEAASRPLSLSRGEVLQAPEGLAHYVAAVRAELVATIGADAVERGGLTVRTALDPGAQEAATAAAVATLDPGDGPPADPAAAVASVEPATGRIRALVSHSGAPYAQSPFNLATQARRQPGSTFKAFVLASALEQGIPLSAVYDSRPLSLPGGYTVGNYRGIYRGATTVEKGLVYSDNAVYTQLALDAGMPNVVDAASRMGIEAPMEPYPSTAIGGLSTGVSPAELAGAYATIASGGERTRPHLLVSVEQTGPDGEEETVFKEAEEYPATQAISPFVAQETGRALRAVVDDGGGRLSELDAATGREIAGKTGTTENFRDAWFVGYPTDVSDGAPGDAEDALVTAVWVGYPDSERPMSYVNGYPRVDGSTVPLDVYARFVAAMG